MEKPIIDVEGLSKRYTIGAQREPYLSLREQLAKRMMTIGLRFSPKKGDSASSTADFWALKDVQFSINRGEAVGIIGKNGAGKSTLLKVLSQITPPTTGTVTMRGRVGSLLEVGTGFHPELTGRENIFLNGAILGMSRSEVRKKFDEIVAFSEIERFLETPVKRYSSGMYVRLAFAVAAHFEPDILLVDEVLAVGDFEFQRKCLGKMGDVARGGQTVLLVSHNMPSLLNLCQKAILLDSGKLVAEGPCREIVSRYLLRRATKRGIVFWREPAKAPGGDLVRLRSISLLNPNNSPTDQVDIAAGCAIEIAYWVLVEGNRLNCTIQLLDQTETMVFSSFNAPSAILGKDPWAGKRFNKGLFVTTCVIPGDFLNEGRYKVNIYIQRDVNLGIYLASLEDAVSFSTYDSGAMRREYGGRWGGVVRPRLEWTTRYAGETDAE